MLKYGHESVQNSSEVSPEASPKGGSDENSRSRLCLKEKLAVGFMLLLLATFAGTSYARKHHKFHSINKTIHIQCLGAITAPKKLELPAGTQVSDLLQHISLTPEADISKLVLEERLKENQVVIIPSKGKVTLYVTGAVKEPGLIYVPESLRFNGLLTYLTLTDDADVGMFRRRRRLLCEGETIHVPAKSEYIVRK